MDLTGRVALVTGGGTGLGHAITLALAGEGMRVAVNYSRSETEAQATVAEVRRLGRQAVAVRADVAAPDDVAAMVDRVVRDFGGLDLLVNNAGVTRYVPVADLDSLRGEDFDRILAVNVKGAFLCAQLAARHMKAAGAGKIVNVASDSAFSGKGSSIPYVVSKAALVMLTRCLARALAPAIQVNAVAPGWLATRWLATYLPPDKQRQVLEDPRHPPVPLAEVTQAVLLLARNDAITGQSLIIDGGVSLD
jgi:3-oxoacyl-[acyl-carrier protein] reductase